MQTLLPPDDPRTETGSREVIEKPQVRKIEPTDIERRHEISTSLLDRADYDRWADDGGNNLD
jgi:hypothetical protein